MLNNLHITVIPFSYKSKECKIEEHHLQLLKFALIYADKTQLFSLTALPFNMISFLIEEISNDKKYNEEFRKLKSDIINSALKQLENIDIKEKEEYKQLELYSRKNNMKIEELIKIILDYRLKKFGEMLLNSFNELRDKIGLTELDPFVKLGVLDVYTIGKSTLNEKTIPLFDEAGLFQINKMILQKKIKMPGVYLNEIKYSALSSELFQRLPDFEKVTFDQIHDIRKTLKKPLIKFRSAMVKLTNNIKLFPWDEGFFVEVDNLIRRDIEPAILELEEECKSNSYLRILSRNILDENIWTLPAGFGVAISKIADLSNISSLLVGLGTGMTKVVLKTFNEWQDKRNKIRMNPYFFYYRMRKMK